MDKVPEKMSKEAYCALALKKCDENHIWLNKMVYYIHPSVEDKIKLADIILDKLGTKSTQIPSSGITCDTEVIRELSELTPTLYLAVNWS